MKNIYIYIYIYILMELLARMTKICIDERITFKRFLDIKGVGMWSYSFGTAQVSMESSWTR
jgi:hypothetical protein